jgi:RNA polymerase sigma-70 factor (ECF subfamily)
MLPFDRLVSAYWHLVVESAREVLGTRAEAEDAAQAVFYRLWATNSWKSVRHPASFLRRAARNEALGMIRRRGKTVMLPIRSAEEIPDSSSPPDEVVDATALGKVVADAFNRLPGRCREVCERVLLTGLSHREVADELSISAKAVEKQVARGRRLLERELQGEGL